jgi:NADH-quinone oxidoreductase subunit A
MNDLLSNYLPIVLFVGLSGLIGLALLVAPFIIAVKSPDPVR